MLFGSVEWSSPISGSSSIHPCIHAHTHALYSLELGSAFFSSGFFCSSADENIEDREVEQCTHSEEQRKRKPLVGFNLFSKIKEER